MTAVIGVPVARREGTGTIQSGGACTIGTVRQVEFSDIYYVAIIVQPKGAIFPSAQAQPGVVPVAKVGEQAIYFPQAGAIIGTVGNHDFSLQVVIGGIPGSLESGLAITKTFVSRL